MKINQAGFTLIEMMVTLTILATLTMAALPLVEKNAQRNKEEELQQSLRQMREAIDQYYKAVQEGRIEKSPEESGYPRDLLALVEGVTDKKSPGGQKIYFLRKIPRDPFCDCQGKSAEQTWQTRSYRDPPGDYNKGRDVYDIASSSNDIGLNGIAYAQW